MMKKQQKENSKKTLGQNTNGESPKAGSPKGGSPKGRSPKGRSKKSSVKQSGAFISKLIAVAKGGGKRYQQFVLVLILMVLVILISQQISFRFDLSQHKMYSISPVSKKMVKNLVLPLRVKVFFSKNLPAPYNNLEQHVKDLLEEYYFSANKNFSYQFYDCTLDKEDSSAKIKANIKEAGDYNIYPVQRQFIEKDEVKFTRVYMGLVIQHGDIIERIDDLGQMQALEYKLTRMIQKMSRKISVLQSLEKEIEVKLFLSSSLQEVAPYINVKGLETLADEIKKVVDKSNKKNYGRLKFSHLDSTADNSVDAQAKKYNLSPLQWQGDANRGIKADEGYITLIIDNDEKYEELNLLKTVSVPFFGTSYALESIEGMDEKINNLVDNVLNLNESIAYLNEKGAPSTEVAFNNPYMPQPNQQREGELSHFNMLLSKTYNFEPIAFEELDPTKYKTLIIVAPKERFTPWELFQIDQFLLAGRSVVVFYEKYTVSSMDRSQLVYGQAPFIAITTGLETLLNHHGVNMKNSILLDKSSYQQIVPPSQGGGSQQIYFIAKLLGNQINPKFKPFRNINELYLNRLSTLNTLSEEELQKKNLKATALLKSSSESWTLDGSVIQFTPATMSPPAATSDTKLQSYPLAYLIEGNFDSYYTSVPEKDDEENQTNNDVINSTNAKAQVQAKVKKVNKIVDEVFLKKGKPGKLFVMAGVENLKNSMMDAHGESSPNPLYRGNAIFLHNLIDYMNNRTDWAIMRSKVAVFNPLEPYDAKANIFMRILTNRQLIKMFNMAILPLLALLVGLFIYYRRKNYRKILFIKFNPSK